MLLGVRYRIEKSRDIINLYFIKTNLHINDQTTLILINFIFLSREFLIFFRSGLVSTLIKLMESISWLKKPKNWVEMMELSTYDNKRRSFLRPRF